MATVSAAFYWTPSCIVTVYIAVPVWTIATAVTSSAIAVAITVPATIALLVSVASVAPVAVITFGRIFGISAGAVCGRLEESFDIET